MRSAACSDDLAGALAISRCSSNVVTAACLRSSFAFRSQSIFAACEVLTRATEQTSVQSSVPTCTWIGGGDDRQGVSARVRHRQTR